MPQTCRSRLVTVLDRRGRHGGRAQGGVLLEVDDLDRLARGQDHAADVVPAVLDCSLISAPSSALSPGGLESDVGYASGMPNIGVPELLIVLVILLLVFGPKRLPGLGRQLGSGMREFKDSITGQRLRR